MLTLAPTEQIQFKDINALVSYTEDMARKTYYWDEPQGKLNNIIRNNSMTEKGLQALCNTIGCPSLFKALMVETNYPEASKEYLRSIIFTKQAEKILDSKFAVMQDDKLIGMVGSRYKPYPNNKFVNDITDNLSQINSEGFKFHGATIINSKLSMKFASEKHTFDLKGDVNDKIMPGIALKTSQTGDTALSSEQWVFRTLCTNGMKIKDLVSQNMVYHVGDNLFDKLKNQISSSNSSLHSIQERIEDLFDIDYIQSSTSAKLLANNAPFKILPELRKRGQFWNSKKKYKTSKDYEDHRQNSINYLDNIPIKHGGKVSAQMWLGTYRKRKSMFDWVESFTEAAQTYPLEVKNKIEEDAGILSNWIADNKYKILN